ncbi:MAG: homoserine kinase [Elusimicrobiota bacterium]
MKKIKVKVPASSANLGPGFDVLGIALQLYNEVEIEELKSPKKLSIEIDGEGKDTLARDKKNIVYRAVEKIYQRVGKKMPPLSLRLTNRIPLARGLGSSASAIIGGMAAANELLGKKLSLEEILKEALVMEGHPDNLVPALVGGLCICYKKDELQAIPTLRPGNKARGGLYQSFRRGSSLAVKNGVSKAQSNEQIRYVKISQLPNWKVVVCIPQYEVSTALARKILLDKISRKDVVFNLSRVALLINAFMSGDKCLLETAMEDRLHQTARVKLVRGMDDVFSAAWQAGALGVALSGSGPTIIAFAHDRSKTKTIGEAMQKAFTQHKIENSLLALEIDKVGVKVC